MTHCVDIKRKAYVGNRAAIEAFHELLSIEENKEILYEGHVPVAYRYSFADKGRAAFFKLTWG